MYPTHESDYLKKPKKESVNLLVVRLKVMYPTHETDYLKKPKKESVDLLVVRFKSDVSHS